MTAVSKAALRAGAATALGLFLTLLGGTAPDSRAAAATSISVECTNTSCLTSGNEMFDPTTGLFQASRCISTDCAANGFLNLRLNAFNSLATPTGGDAFLNGWTETVGQIPGGTVFSTATCRGAGCFVDGIDYSTVKGVAPSGTIDFLGLNYDVGTASLICTALDCGANGWEIVDAWDRKIAAASCKAGGCFTEGYDLTTYALLPPPVVPLPAPVWLLGLGLLALAGAGRIRRHSTA